VGIGSARLPKLTKQLFQINFFFVFETAADTSGRGIFQFHPSVALCH